MSVERFDAAACRFAGFQPRFHCIGCSQPVTEAAVFNSLDLMQTVRFYLRCHDRSTMVDLPMEFFMKIPDRRRFNGPDANLPSPWGGGPPDGSSALRFVVGFEGTWGVRLRNYDWLLRSPHSFYTALGAFRQEQLGVLFNSPDRRLGYDLDSEFFNIVNTEHNFEFPAEFWFPTEKMRRFAQDSEIRSV